MVHSVGRWPSHRPVERRRTFSQNSRLKNPLVYAIRMIDRVKVKGKSEQIIVYEAFETDPPAIKQAKLATLQTFTEALSFYHLGAIEQARQKFKECLQENPQDLVTNLYLERCRQSFLNQLEMK